MLFGREQFAVKTEMGGEVIGKLYAKELVPTPIEEFEKLPEDEKKLRKAYTPGVPKGSISDLAKFEAAGPEFWVPNGYAVANVGIRGIGYWADKIPNFSKVVVPACVTAGWNHFHLQGSVNG